MKINQEGGFDFQTTEHKSQKDYEVTPRFLTKEKFLDQSFFSLFHFRVDYLRLYFFDSYCISIH